MMNFKDSAVAWFKDKRYWEGVFVVAVTTLFGEWVAIAAFSALVNKEVIRPRRASEALQGIIHFFGWTRYVISKQLGQEGLGTLSSAINIVLGIYNQVATGPGLPSAGTVLLSQPVDSGYNGYIWGYFLSENDPSGNTFLVQWVSGSTTYQQMVVMNGPGTVSFISVKAVNDGLPASPNTTMIVAILNAASTNALHMGGMLYGQVPS
jgi:hypothetical protein